MIAYSRPFLPLFLHVLGAMVLVGAMLAVLVVTFAAWRRPEVAALRRAALWTLLVVALPAWVVMRIGAQWIHTKEFGSSGGGDPTWVDIGFAVADLGPALPARHLGCRLLVEPHRHDPGRAPGRRARRRLPRDAGRRLARDVRQVVLARLQNFYRRGGSFLVNGE